MRIVNSIIIALLTALFFTGCGRVTTDALAKEVQANIEQTWAKEPDLATAQIKSFTLVHQGGQQYRGLLEAEQEGESLSFGVDVTYDGRAFMWEITQ